MHCPCGHIGGVLTVVPFLDQNNRMVIYLETFRGHAPHLKITDSSWTLLDKKEVVPFWNIAAKIER